MFSSTIASLWLSTNLASLKALFRRRHISTELDRHNKTKTRQAGIAGKRCNDSSYPITFEPGPTANMCLAKNFWRKIIKCTFLERSLSFATNCCWPVNYAAGGTTSASRLDKSLKTCTDGLHFIATRELEEELSLFSTFSTQPSVILCHQSKLIFNFCKHRSNTTRLKS